MSEKEAENSIAVISNRVCAQIRIDDIEYIEQVGRKVHIVSSTGEYCFYEKMRNVAPAITERAFYRVMKGLIINCDKIARLENHEIVFESGRTYGMGRNNFIKLRQVYKRYLLQYPPFAFHKPRNMEEKRT